MQLMDLLPVPARGALYLFLGAAVFGAGWEANGWRLKAQLERQVRVQTEQLAQRDQLHHDTLAEVARAAATQQRQEIDRRLQLEQQLKQDSAAHYQELTHAQKESARLRDRLATADLRLSVLIDATSISQHCAMPATPGAGSVVHGPARAELDPAAAQRIVAITEDGDQGLIALAACQGYIRAVLKSGAE